MKEIKKTYLLLFFALTVGTTAFAGGNKTPLHQAAKDGDLETVRELIINQRVDPNITLPENGKTPLHYAASCDNIRLAKLLINWGADTTITDNRGRTALHHAAASGKKSIARYLAKIEASLNMMNRETSLTAEDANGETPDQTACSSHHREIANSLQEIELNFAKIRSEEINPHGDSQPLHQAAEDGALAIVQDLVINQGIDPNLGTPDGFTPLHYAANFGHLGITKFLIEQGVDPTAANKSGWTPLHCAAFFGHNNIAEFLIRHKADPKATTISGWTPLHQAIKYRRLKTARFLAEQDIEVNGAIWKGSEKGWTPLLLAWVNCYKDIAKLLSEKGADPYGFSLGEDSAPQFNYELAPLVLAIKRNQLELAKFFLDKARENSLADQTSLILETAREKGDQKVIERLTQMLKSESKQNELPSLILTLRLKAE